RPAKLVRCGTPPRLAVWAWAPVVLRRVCGLRPARLQSLQSRLRPRPRRLELDSAAVVDAEDVDVARTSRFVVVFLEVVDVASNRPAVAAARGSVSARCERAVGLKDVPVVVV